MKDIWLVMKTADGQERPFRVRRRRTLIGRATHCDLRLALPTVDKRHCELRFDDGVLELNDLNTEGGTYHNGRRVQSARLDHSDELTIGPVTFEVRLGPTVTPDVSVKPALDGIAAGDGIQSATSGEGDGTSTPAAHAQAGPGEPAQRQPPASSSQRTAAG